MSEGTWIRFVLVERLPKTDVYNIISKDDECRIGQIRWLGRWRKYCFFPDPNTVYENVCLGEISSFIKELMEKRKNGEGR